VNLSEIIALLCNEPFSLDVDRAKRLTLFQVRKLYFRPRDREGRIEIDSPKGEFPDGPTWKKLAAQVIRVPMWYVRERDAKLNK
jgi:hypothetical protein